MRVLFSLLCLFSTVLLQAEEEEIFVQLSNEIELMPIFVSSVEQENMTLPTGYPEAIRQVFLFDINHNGSTCALTPKEVNTFPSLKNQNSFGAELDFSKLKNDGILYLTKLKLKDKELIVKVISVNSQTANTIDRVFLTGDLNRDRQKVHQVADSIHKLLFGKPGIATCRIMYTTKKKIEHPKQGTKWVSEVFMSDYDGYNARQLTQDGSLAANPLFLPSKDANNPQFLYVSYKIGQPKIYRASSADKRLSRVSPLKANQVTPAINSSGTMLAFSSDVSGRADIFIQPLTSPQGEEVKPRQIFTAKGSANASPTFSPDGKRIAFVSDKDGSPKVYIMNIPSPNTKLKDIKPQLISMRCRENSAPCWSPDGKKIAYCSKNSGERQIWIYDLETKKERQLTQGKASKENPVWAPDSLHILFNAIDSQGTEIYLINLNQPEAVKITSGPGIKLFPAWELTPR